MKGGISPLGSHPFHFISQRLARYNLNFMQTFSRKRQRRHFCSWNLGLAHSMMMMHLSCSRRLFLVPLPSCRSRSPPSDPSWQLAPQDNTPPATRVGTGINSGGCWQGVGDHCNNRAGADPNFTPIGAERYQHGQVLVLR